MWLEIAHKCWDFVAIWRGFPSPNQKITKNDIKNHIKITNHQKMGPWSYFTSNQTNFSRHSPLLHHEPISLVIFRCSNMKMTRERENRFDVDNSRQHRTGHVLQIVCIMKNMDTYDMKYMNCPMQIIHRNMDVTNFNQMLFSHSSFQHKALSN